MADNKRMYGLIGHPLAHSFSEKYFTEKFKRENVKGHVYRLFPLESIELLPLLLAAHPHLCGLNVTIPYKQAVLPFLDKLDPEAEAIGAVNVIKIGEGKMTGYNSDAYGFELSLKSLLSKSGTPPPNIGALILGTGGASMAIRFVLDKLNIYSQYVSRTNIRGNLTYKEITPDVLHRHQLVINCTPLGTYPNVDTCPDLPYDHVGDGHFFYDLVYNPEETLFLKKAKAQGALTINGLPMLHLQAERSWEIWNS